MAIKDLIFLKQRKSAPAFEIGAWGMRYDFIDAANNIVGGSTTGVFSRVTQGGVTEFQMQVVDVNTPNVYVKKFSNGDYLVIASGNSTGSTFSRISPAGVKIWAKKFSSNYAFNDASVCVDENDDVVAVAPNTAGDSAILKLAFATGVIAWQKQTNLNANGNLCTLVSVSAKNGFIYATGITTMEGLILIKYSSAGVRQWSKTIYEYNGYSRRLDVDSSGNIYIAVNTDNIIKLSSSGAISSAVSINGVYGAMEISLSPSGKLMVANFYGELLELDTALNLTSAVHTTNNINSYGFAYDASGNVYTPLGFKFKSGLASPTIFYEADGVTVFSETTASSVTVSPTSFSAGPDITVADTSVSIALTNVTPFSVVATPAPIALKYVPPGTYT